MFGLKNLTLHFLLSTTLPLFRTLTILTITSHSGIFNKPKNVSVCEGMSEGRAKKLFDYCCFSSRHRHRQEINHCKGSECDTFGPTSCMIKRLQLLSFCFAVLVAFFELIYEQLRPHTGRQRAFLALHSRCLLRLSIVAARCRLYIC